MPKFHDEFFSQKGKEHDDLVAEVLFDIDAVAELLRPIPTPEPYEHAWWACPVLGHKKAWSADTRYADDGGILDHVCSKIQRNCEDWRNLFNISNYVNSARYPECFFCGSNMTPNTCLVFDGVSYSCSDQKYDIKKLVTIQSPDDQEKIIGAICSCANGNLTYNKHEQCFHANVEGNVFFQDYEYKHTRKIKKETEHIFYGSNQFILGYGDIILDVTDEFKAYNGEHVLSEITNSVSYVIDCKPKLDDMGAVARQIKTYAAFLRGDKTPVKVIVTCQKDLSRSTKIIAANENIVLIVYDKEKRQFSLAPPLLVETKLE